MDKLAQRLGARIKQIRKTAKITQEKLAEKTELSVEYISRLERGVSQPSFKTLSIMAERLNVDIKDFFDFNVPVLFKDKKQEEKQKKGYIDAISHDLKEMEVHELMAVYNVIKGLTER
ncbi:MAG: helix-turn-helix transcriptional regulator [Nitrospinae bacterium]|nr:helix-turn-helix transcriptional regulator [Nitrospinota bacterium]